MAFYLAAEDEGVPFFQKGGQHSPKTKHYIPEYLNSNYVAAVCM
jgi:hypothetical protein